MPASVGGKAIEELVTLAEGAARTLAAVEDVAALSLLGSVARGNASHESDVDLLVITRRLIRGSVLMRVLPPSVQDDRISLLCFSLARWEAEARRGALFLHHVRLEGRPLYDPVCVLENGFNLLAQSPPDVDGEIRQQVRRLRLYRDVERLNGRCLFALAHLYAIGKATAIARCVDLGEAVFVKELALRRLARSLPHLAPAAEVVLRLRPFYDLTRGRVRTSMPFAETGAEKEVLRAVSAIEQIADG